MYKNETGQKYDIYMKIHKFLSNIMKLGQNAQIMSRLFLTSSFITIWPKLGILINTLFLRQFQFLCISLYLFYICGLELEFRN